MSASSLSLPIFLRINFLISYLDSNRLTEHNRLTHTESFAEWQKSWRRLHILVMTSPHLTSGRQFWLITHMIQSWTTLMAFPIASRRSSMFPEGNLICVPKMNRGLIGLERRGWVINSPIGTVTVSQVDVSDFHHLQGVDFNAFLNCNNISQCHCWYCFYHINAA